MPLRQLTLHEDISRLLTGGGVDVEVLEEDLGQTGGRSAALGVVLGLDVDGRVHGGVRVIEGGRLAVSTGDTVALGLGSLDDELEVGHAVGNAREGEGHRGTGDDHSCGCGSIDAAEGGRSGKHIATAIHDPIVEAEEEVGTGDLALGAKDGLALGGIGRSVPGEDLLVGETVPSLRKLLEDGLHGRLVGGAGSAAITTVADVLASAGLGRGYALCGA